MKKISDRKSAMRASLLAEKKEVNARFAMADTILAERPTGLANAPSKSSTTFSAENIPLEKQKIVSVPLDQIHENPLNARHIYIPDVIKSLAASIAIHGQMTPAPAVEHPTLKGHFILIDGHYRKKAISVAGQHAMNLIVSESKSEIEMYQISWLLNEERNAQSPLDNSYSWRKLLNDGIVKNEGEIADLVGVSLSTVNKTLLLLNLPSGVLEKMQEHPEKFGVFIGYELTLAAKKLDETEMISLVNKIIQEDLSTREVSTIRTKLEIGNVRKRKETSRQYKIQQNGLQIGSLKEWDSGKILFDITVKESKDRISLVTELLRRFDIGEDLQGPM